MTEAMTLQLPDRLYQRLVHTAQATQRSLEAVVMRALDDLQSSSRSDFTMAWASSFFTLKGARKRLGY